jgi:hypothetical protein
MALKFASIFVYGPSGAGWRICLGTLAAAMLLVAGSALAEDPQEAVKSAVESDQIQRNRPEAKDAVDSAVGGDNIQRSAPSGGESDAERERRLGKERSAEEREKARKSIGDAGNQDDIQRDRPNGNQPPAAPSRIGSMDFSWLPYVILGIIGVALVYVLLRYITNRMSKRNPASAKAVVPATKPQAVAPAGPSAPERDRTFDEIDALAESGAFTEAVHRLLLLVQERLRTRVEHGLQVSLTSREILRRAKLPQDAATSFATLVAAVEVSLFGMRNANAATYTLCRENCRRVLAATAGMRA